MVIEVMKSSMYTHFPATSKDVKMAKKVNLRLMSLLISPKKNKKNPT